MSKDKEETEGSARKKIKLDEQTTADQFFPRAEPLDIDKIYPKVCEFYNDLSIKRPADSDWEEFQKTTAHIVSTMDEITQLKTDKPENWEAKVAEKRSEVALAVIYMKKLNRCEKLRIKASRETTLDKKQETESLYLELQNMLCDIDHISNEVDKCLELRHMNFGIDLIPVEEFYREAPESLAKPDKTRGDEHLRQLARLEWELRQRKDKAVLCEYLETKRKDVLTDIKNNETTIESLAPLVADLLTAAKPLSEKLGIKTNSPESVDRLNVLSLLPDRLYFLYVQADAYREACDKKLLLSISGNLEAAKKFKPEPLRLVEANEDDPTMSLDERRKKYMTKHPLSVIMKIVLKDRNSIVVSFHYLVYMKVLSVSPKVVLTSPVSPDSAAKQLLKDKTILNELFPGDTGTISPNPANYYQLKKLGLEKVETERTGLVYRWVQKLAGLDFVRSPRKGDRSIQLTQATIPVVLRNIRQRLTARLALASQIISFENGHVSVPASMAGIKLTSCLKSWRPIKYKDFAARPFTNFLLSSSSGAAPPVSSTDFFYRAIIKNLPAVIETVVVIKPNYPNSSPIFAIQILLTKLKLNSRNSPTLRELERGVNLYWEELIVRNRSPLYLLSGLLHKALVDLQDFLTTNYPELFPNQSAQREVVQPQKKESDEAMES